MTIETAEDMARELTEGTTFAATGPWIRANLTVERVSPAGSENNMWFFDAVENTEDEQKWRFKVFPSRGGPNDGVVEAYWYAEGDELAGGHHEYYPKAFEVQ